MPLSREQFAVAMVSILMNHGEHHHHDHAAPSGAPSLKDPVCGMNVDPETAAGPIVHKGTAYYFCGQKCLARFTADPDAFVGHAHEHVHGSPIKHSVPGGKYTCPMHPEIIRDAPGACPICGMALEPITPLASAQEPNSELIDMTQRFWVALALTLPILAEMLLPDRLLMSIVTPTAMQWTMLVLATPVVLWAGFPFFERGYQSIRSRNLNMFT